MKLKKKKQLKKLKYADLIAYKKKAQVKIAKFIKNIDAISVNSKLRDAKKVMKKKKAHLQIG